MKSSEIREFMVGKFQVLFTVEDICGHNKLEELISPVITDAKNFGLCHSNPYKD